MRRNTPKRAKEQREYLKRSREWLDGQACAVCLSEWADNDAANVQRAEQCHHMRGRIGALLLDERYWLPVCAVHHHWITEHPTQAVYCGWSLPRVSHGCSHCDGTGSIRIEGGMPDETVYDECPACAA